MKGPRTQLHNPATKFYCLQQGTLKRGGEPLHTAMPGLLRGHGPRYMGLATAMWIPLAMSKSLHHREDKPARLCHRGPFGRNEVNVMLHFFHFRKLEKSTLAPQHPHHDKCLIRRRGLTPKLLSLKLSKNAGHECLQTVTGTQFHHTKPKLRERTSRLSCYMLT